MKNIVEMINESRNYKLFEVEVVGGLYVVVASDKAEAEKLVNAAPEHKGKIGMIQEITGYIVSGKEPAIVVWYEN